MHGMLNARCVTFEISATDRVRLNVIGWQAGSRTTGRFVQWKRQWILGYSQYPTNGWMVRFGNE